MNINCDKCPRCNRLLNHASNRLVTDTCGHQKCRQCLLTDETDCLDCKEMSETALIIENQIIVPSENSSQTNSFPNHIQKTTMPNGEEKYFCSICGKRFASRSQQYYHFACGNEDAKRFSCTFTNCNKRFKTRAHLSYHLQAHTPGNYKCAECGKMFKHQKVLQKHQRNHNLETVSCEKCGKSFRSSVSLATHMALHSDEQLPFKCTVCARCYLTKSALMQHAHKHDVKPQHQCLICHKFYQRNSILQVHMKRHKKDQIYECAVCHKLFCDADALLRHKKQHMESSLLIKYRCMHCEITTIRKDNMQRHVRNMHGADTDFTSCVEIIAATSADVNLVNTPITPIPQTVENSSVIKCIGNVKPIKVVPNSSSKAAENVVTEIVEPEAALKPCKKAKYNPINLYRKILDLPGETESREAETDETGANIAAAIQPIVEEAAQTTPEMHLHWRKKFKFV